MFLSIIIPTYNEEKRLKKTLEEIRNFLNNQNYDSEVLVVDDGSIDKTCQIVQQFDWPQKIKPNLIKSIKNHGKGYVVKKGILAAQGDYILFTDADNSTPIEEVNKLLLYKNDYPVIIGSRYLKQGSVKRKQSLTRRLISRLGMWLIKIIIGLPIVDTQCGFKLFSRRVTKNIFNRAIINRWGFDIEILAIANSLGYRIKEVPVSWYDDPISRLRAGKAAWQTLKELIKIKTNLMKGTYKRTN